MMPTLLPRHVTARPDLLTHSTPAGLVLLDPRTQRYFGLDGVAADAFLLLRESRSPSEVVDALLRRYDVDRSQLEGDLADFFNQLHDAALVGCDPPPAHAPHSSGPLGAHPDAVLRNLGVWIQRGFLTRAECADLCQQMRTAPGQEAGVDVRGHKDSRVDLNRRRTWQVEVPEPRALALLERLRTLRDDMQAFYGLPLHRLLERPKFLLYRAGDYFRPHVDTMDYEKSAGLFVRPIVGARRVNLIIYLNDQTAPGEPAAPDTYSGGGLTLYGLVDDPAWQDHGLLVRGEAGMLLAFRAELLHEVAPIHSGERFAVVSRMLDPNFEADEAPTPGLP